MKIAFNPSTVAALTTPPNNKDITFDLRGRNIFARGVKFYGTDTNTWRDIKVNNVSIGSHTLDLRNGSNTTLTNTNGVVTINSTWRPVVDNLTSNSTTSSLSANQGRVLKALIDGKSDSGHNHDGRYVRYYVVTTLDCNNLAVGLTAARVSATNAAHTNHSVYLYISDIGTPFQIQIPDFNVPYIYKRYYSSGKWSGWFKLNAGYADSAGSVAWTNITGKPSSYTPSAHTHAWNSLTHSSTTENQAILTNGKANGWKLYTLNISGWNNAANNAHSHSNKSVLDGITSSLVNNWNTAYTFVHTITGTDTDKVINKWDEIVNFLAGITEDNKLNTLLNSKLSVYELADKTNVGTIKNNGIYYSTTDASSGTLTNSPFNTGFALINMTSYDGGDDLRRSRLAFNAYGEIKVSDDRGQSNTAETWYNVLTSKNSGISGSTIKLNGTSITVYSSDTADGRYVKKSGDTMTGVLTIDTTNFGALTIKRNDDTNGASIQFRGKSSVYGYIGLNNNTKDKQFLRYSSDGSKTYTILDTSSTYISNGKGIINGSTITQVDNADTVDGEHASNFSYTHQTSFDFGTTKSGRIVTFDQSTDNYGWINGFASTHNNYLTSVLFNTHRTSNWYVGYIEGNSSTGKTKGLQAVHKLAFADQIPTSLKNPYSLTLKANGTTLAIYDGSSAKEANFTYANVGAASASHTHTYIVAEDLRNKYPAQILDPMRMKLSFLAASTLGIKNNGTYYDVITVRSYVDATAGSDNALLFSKNTNSLYHTRFAFGSTDSWGSPLLIIDSGNIGSQSVNYANSANHANSAGNANTLGGTSLGGLFTAFGNNAHNITATIGGVTKSFLVNYAADADKLDGKHASDFATVGHNHDSRYVKIWGNVEANFNFPDGEGHSGVYMCHTTKTQSNKPETYGLLTDFSTGNGHLQFFGASPNKIYTRTYWWTGQDNFKYTDWHTLLHTGNSSVSGHTITINGTSTTWSNSWRPIGTGASDAAAGNHTHKVKINGSEKTIAATGVTDLGTYLTSQSLRGYVHAYNNTGTGNAVTSISIEGGTITANKGTTFLTSHQSLANYYTKGQVDTKLGKYLPLAGGTMDAGAQIQRTATGGMWYQGRSIALLRETSAGGYHALWSLKTTDGSWDFGEYNSSGWNNIPVLSYVLDSNFDKGSNITTYQIKFPLASGTIALTSNILNPTNYYWANNKITSTSKIDAEVRVKNLGAGCSTTIENTIMATNWVRAMGNTGIYFQDHGGGLYMSDNTWIRTWAGKALQVDNTIRGTDFHTTYYANNVWTITSAARLENSTTLVYGTNTSSQSINTYLRGTNVTLQVKKDTSINYNALELTSDRINCNNYCDMKYGAAVSGGNFTVWNNSYLAQIIGSKVGIGTKNPQYTLDVGDKMRAGGYIHSGHNSNDAMLLAGGGWKKLSTLVEYPSDESYIYRKTTTEYDLRFVKLVNFNNLIYVDGWISADANGKSFTLGAKFKPYLYRDDHSIPTIVQMGWDDVVTIDGDGNVGFHIEGGRKKRIGFFYTGRA